MPLSTTSEPRRSRRLDLGRSAPFAALVALLLAGCSTEGSPAAPPSPRPWQRLATPTSALPGPRGFRPVRGIVHSHSPFSHDACDGEGLTEDGAVNAPCADDLRRGMCEAAEDFVFLTDHPAHMAEQPFEDLLFLREGDEPVKGPDGSVIANAVACPDGRRVLVSAGHEDALMSVGLTRHVPGDAAQRDALYNSDTPEAVDAMHAAGALVFVPHTESHSLDYLKSAHFDGIEVFNLHASIDPDIRSDYLGLDAYSAVAAVLPFATFNEGAPEPDFTILGFLEELPIYASYWDALLPLRHVPGVAGTDVHQNTIATTLRDNERGDSYRRLMRWFSNIVLLDGELTPEALKGALRDGRSYVAFEILGTPAGFDLHAKQGDATIELGGTAAPGASIHVRAPTVLNPDPAVSPPDISMRLLRVTPGKTEVVGEGPAIDLESAEPGAYRAEVRITPHHLRPYLGDTPETYLRTYLWVISNPIYIE